MGRRAAQSLDAGAESATMDAAMAKRFATDACFSVADDAVQVCDPVHNSKLPRKFFSASACACLELQMLFCPPLGCLQQCSPQS